MKTTQKLFSTVCLLFCLGLFVFGCKKEQPSAPTSETIPPTTTDTNPSPTPPPVSDSQIPTKTEKQPGTIGDKSLGDLKLGDPISDIPTSFTKKDRAESFEGADYTRHQYFSGEELLFEVVPSEDGKNISEITVFSRFKTPQGIGVGSSIKDFSQVCSEYQVVYAYEPGRYFLACPSISYLQLELNPTDYQGPKPITPKEDLEILKPGAFKEEAQITQIRIY